MAGSSVYSWALTDAGRAEDERRLGAELDQCGARSTVVTAYADFDQLNERFLDVIKNWQIRPARGDSTARNDHSDRRWDEGVLDALGTLDRSLRPVCVDLMDVLDRFDGYADRFSTARYRVDRGDRSWVTGGRDRLLPHSLVRTSRGSPRHPEHRARSRRVSAQ